MVAHRNLGAVQGFKILNVIIYVNHIKKKSASKTQAPQPPALQKNTPIPGVPLCKIRPGDELHRKEPRDLQSNLGNRACESSAHTTTQDVCCGVHPGCLISPSPPTLFMTLVGFKVFPPPTLVYLLPRRAYGLLCWCANFNLKRPQRQSGSGLKRPRNGLGAA